MSFSNMQNTSNVELQNTEPPSLSGFLLGAFAKDERTTVSKAEYWNISREFTAEHEPDAPLRRGEFQDVMAFFAISGCVELHDRTGEFSIHHDAVAIALGEAS